MSTITQANLVMKLRAASEAAAKRGFSGELYDAAANEVEQLRATTNERRQQMIELAVVTSAAFFDLADPSDAKRWKALVGCLREFGAKEPRDFVERMADAMETGRRAREAMA